MAGTQPSPNDREYNLLKKIVNNMNLFAVARNIPNPPASGPDDTYFDLLRKLTEITYLIANT